jgi:hypothetical protein
VFAVPTKHELLLRQMSLKLARAVLGLEGAFLASKPTLTTEVEERLKTVDEKLDEFLALLDQTDELDKIG